MLVLGACVMAPLFEEVLFRGHMQTLLTRLFTAVAVRLPPELPAPLGYVRDARAPQVGEVLPPPPLPPVAYATPDTPTVTAEGVRTSGAMRWLAVILTSLVFALVHPLWMAPLIFVLSLCLGYAYERDRHALGADHHARAVQHDVHHRLPVLHVTGGRALASGAAKRGMRR
jgi:hypothetical protein